MSRTHTCAKTASISQRLLLALSRQSHACACIQQHNNSQSAHHRKTAQLADTQLDGLENSDKSPKSFHNTKHSFYCSTYLQLLTLFPNRDALLTSVIPFVCFQLKYRCLKSHGLEAQHIMPDISGAAVGVGAATFVATNVVHLRGKYKTTPIAWDCEIATHEDLKWKEEKSRTYREEHRGEYRKRSDASAEGREESARNVLESDQKFVEKARRFKDMDENKEGSWNARAYQRLRYDQYGASRRIKNKERVFIQIENGNKEHDRRVAARKRDKKEEVRKAQGAVHNVENWDDGEIDEQLSTSSRPPSLDSKATTIDESDSFDEYDSDEEYQQHNIPLPPSQNGYDTGYASQTGFDEKGWQHHYPPFPPSQNGYGTGYASQHGRRDGYYDGRGPPY
jgi:hypothetical protein